MNTRRRILAALLAAAVAPTAAVAQDNYPNRPIRIIVPFAPGGITDVMARLLGKVVGDELGQTVIVENRPGGGTLIGTEAGVRSKPDGYTILMVSAPIVTNQGLYAKLPYDVARDLTPLIQLTAQGFVISVNASQPYQSLKELVEAARKASPEVIYASPGNGTLMHLLGPVFDAEYGTRLVHVPYKGSGPALQDAVAGIVPMVIDPISTSLAPIRQGKLRPLAVTHPTRLAALPDVPTVAELGFPKAQSIAFSGLMMPAGTPPEIIEKLNGAFNRGLKHPEVRQKLVDQMGSTLAGGTPQEFGAFLQAEVQRWVPVIQRLGLKAE
jgi:tripartite-type tricarboxylate transporter receptor subunit TctC